MTDCSVDRRWICTTVVLIWRPGNTQIQPDEVLAVLLLSRAHLTTLNHPRNTYCMVQYANLRMTNTTNLGQLQIHALNRTIALSQKNMFPFIGLP